jgi:hypothetical protein
MSLPERYGKRVKSALGGVAVWMPGTPVPLGTIMVKGEGQFHPFDHISSFTDRMTTAPHQDQSLDLVSSGTKQRIFQANAELPGSAQLDLAAEATVKYEFTRAFEYVLKTPTLRGSHIANLNQLAQAAKAADGWRHKDFYLVHKVYDAEEFSFVGSERSSSSIELSGKGSAILGFLSAGASAGISSTGNAEVKLIGAGGSIAMGLVRIKKDGTTDFV